MFNILEEKNPVQIEKESLCLTLIAKLGAVHLAVVTNSNWSDDRLNF